MRFQRSLQLRRGNEKFNVTFRNSRAFASYLNECDVSLMCLEEILAARCGNGLVVFTLNRAWSLRRKNILARRGG